MTQGRDVNDPELEELLESEWPEEVGDSLSPEERDPPGPRGGPKWKAIEDHWERQRLRKALQDYLEDRE